MRKSSTILSVAVITLLLVCCTSRPQPVAQQPAEDKPNDNSGGIKLTSSAFKEGQPIPATYTCKGVNISPPLEWSGVPKTARTIAIIADDPDAPSGTWVHWVLYNLPADNIGIVENLPPTESLKAGGFQGKNDFGKIGYGGPCPPSGTHRYFFKILALDGELPLKAGATKTEVEKAMAGHVVAQGQLMGRFGR
ncbi:MAG TPA: YbhB/YbcL family Raf kinase inhibitor-like protein [Pyrinomonadaceae bacterium]|nr:YbhB/YbcL family Raf kinase inhibitor-like protein [Pyrinomonadaceae bacterium]